MAKSSDALQAASLPLPISQPVTLYYTAAYGGWFYGLKWPFVRRKQTFDDSIARHGFEYRQAEAESWRLVTWFVP